MSSGQDRPLGIAFGVASILFLALFRWGNRAGFEVPLFIRGLYLLGACAFLVRHGIRTNGAKRFLRFCAAVFIVSAGAETLGVATGWLFGSYAYTDRLGPLLPGGVPLAIPVFWILMLYAADDLAGLAVGRGRLLRAITAGAIAATWDLMVDPIAVAYECWGWVGGGPVFGIPASNAAGWWLVGTLAALAGGATGENAPPTLPHWFHHLPALALLGAALNNLMGSFELGFPAAGLASVAALSPYAIVASVRLSRRRST